ncbi:MAG: ABC transporter permease [Bacteroidia bacterium]|nr:ABC transporter permease [Bacteroidia bacterium]
MTQQQSPRPPSWMEKFLLWGLETDIAEDILGDLHELFRLHLQEKNNLYARWKYFLSMLSLLRLFRFKFFFDSLTFINLAMIQHYFIIALRNLRKHLSYSLINILGLGTGLAACLLLLLFVRHEMSYDRFHKNHDRIFRVSMEVNSGGTIRHVSVSPTALSPVFQREFPEVEKGVRIFSSGKFSPDVVRYESKIFQEMGFFFADSSFFDIFSFSLTAGDLRTALRRPSTVIISQSMAHKYFGTENPVGKILNLNNNRDYEITGVMQDMPPNSHFHADFLASFSTLNAAKEEIWGSANYQTYLLLQSPEAVYSLREKIPAFIQRIQQQLSGALGPETKLLYRLTPLTDIHLYSDAENELEPGSDIRYVYAFSAIALLILLIACINYMNLATARSVDRAREVGLRKVVGAYKSQIFAQFMGESVMITFLAVIFSVVFAKLILPTFNALIHRDLSLNFIQEPSLLLMLAIIGLIVSLVAGIWPALIFTKFEPVAILRGKYRTASGGSLLRKSLVVFQFVISVFLIVCTFVVYNQLQLIRQTRLGYDKDQLVVIPIDRDIAEKWEAIKGMFKSVKEIEQVSAVSENPTKVDGTYNLFKPSNEENSDLVQAIASDIDLVQTLGLEIIAGTNYTPASALREDFPFILNQTAIKMLGWEPQEAIGKPINLNRRAGFVQAVVRDFHIASLHSQISPLVIFLSPFDYNETLVRITPGDPQKALAHLEKIWKEQAPHRPFEYHFLDETYQQLYQSEQQIGKAFGIFAALAILIACMGLFGLASFTTVQRAKEIGIRKVLGATVMNILTLLSKEFSRLVIIAVVIALPLAAWVMDSWLSNFAYRVNVSIFTLLIAGGLALLLAWLTVGYHSLRTALTNPAETLKDE